MDNNGFERYQNSYGNQQRNEQPYRSNNGQQFNRSNNGFNSSQRNFNSNNFGSGSNGWRGNKGQNFYQSKQEEDVETTLYKCFVGTGNKEAPDHVLERMRAITGQLEQFGYTLRTGGMEGPDEIFETASKNPELYLPWKGFNNKESKHTFNTKQSLDIAKLFHPTFEGLKPAIQAFLAKNARMVLGKDLKSPAMFIICWSEDGAENSKEKTAKTGNVGHVIAIASAMKIPVFNFGKPDAEQRLRSFLELPGDNNVENKQTRDYDGF
jgi:hypothetical protein